MNRNIYNRIKKIIQHHFLIYPLTAKHQFQKDLGFSDLEFKEMIFYIEDEFQVEISDSELPSIATIRDAAYLVQKYKVAS